LSKSLKCEKLRIINKAAVLFPMAYLIIGVDPGHTIGLAALDLSGKPIKTAHIQQGGFEAAVAELESWGTPSIIASDVRPAPELVLKLASAFNAALFIPQKPWREEEKKKAIKEMAGQFSFYVENVHERDALSAAIKAWRFHQNTLRQASPESLSEEEIGILRHLLLQGIRQAVAIEMIKKLRQQEEKGKEAKEQPSAQNGQEAKRQLQEPATLLHSLERTISELKKRIAFLEAERESLLYKIKLLENGVIGLRLADREKLKMAAKIKRLQAYIHYMKKNRKKMAGTAEEERAEKISSKEGKYYGFKNQQELQKEKSIAKKPEYTDKISNPAALDDDLKKLNAIRLQKIIEEYRRGRSHQ
jgi:predicted RNase H-like nuclease (RuvC/YqgF family)